MAVEPRKIKQPTESGSSSPIALEAEASAGSSAAGVEGDKKSLPIIPIFAGLVALIVVGLLGKVVLSK